MTGVGIPDPTVETSLFNRDSLRVTTVGWPATGKVHSGCCIGGVLVEPGLEQFSRERIETGVTVRRALYLRDCC